MKKKESIVTIKKEAKKKIYGFADGYGLDYYMDASKYDCGAICATTVYISRIDGVFFYAELTKQIDEKIKKILRHKWEGCISQDAKSRRALKVIKEEASKIKFIAGGGKESWDKIPYKQQKVLIEV